MPAYYPNNEPTLIPNTVSDQKKAGQPVVISGMCKSNASFPIINKDNYALGSFCLVHSKKKAFTEQQIIVIGKLVARLAN